MLVWLEIIAFLFVSVIMKTPAMVNAKIMSLMVVNASVNRRGDGDAKGEIRKKINCLSTTNPLTLNLIP